MYTTSEERKESKNKVLEIERRTLRRTLGPVAELYLKAEKLTNVMRKRKIKLLWTHV